MSHSATSGPTNQVTLDALSDLMAYPGADYPARLKAGLVAIGGENPDVAASLAPLVELVETGAPGAIEELYTRSFDMNPTCALELGWHLYGEDYDRGAFLVTVRELMRLHGVEENGELPDHLTHILPLVTRLEPDEGRRFSQRQALPAIERVVANFTEEDHPYRALLHGVRSVLEATFGPADAVPASAFACPAPYDDTPIQCSGLPQRPEALATPTNSPTKGM